MSKKGGLSVEAHFKIEKLQALQIVGSSGQLGNVPLVFQAILLQKFVFSI